MEECKPGVKLLDLCKIGETICEAENVVYEVSKLCTPLPCSDVEGCAIEANPNVNGACHNQERLNPLVYEQICPRTCGWPPKETTSQKQHDGLRSSLRL